MKKIMQAFMPIIVTLVLLFGTVAGSVNAEPSSAAAAEDIASSAVLDDLNGMTVDGTPFDPSAYPKRAGGTPDVLVLAEYCYTYYENQRDNYALYVYVYNPAGTVWNTASERNTVQLSAGEKPNYIKYPLIFLNKSVDDLFYKFRIGLTAEQRAAILSVLDSSERVYDLSGIELLSPGAINPTDYAIEHGVYRYSGYGNGCGVADSEGSTLSYLKEAGLSLVIGSEDIGQASYRPAGTNGETNYTQDTLSTVYFAVPTPIVEKYGSLVRVRAEWLRALTQWGLVTGNKTAYDFFERIVGVDTLASGYGLYSDYYDYGLLSTQINDKRFAFNCPVEASEVGADLDIRYISSLFYSGSAKDSAGSYNVSSKIMLEWMQAYHDKYDNYESKSIDESWRDHPAGTLIQNTTFKTPYGGAYLSAGGQTYGYSRALFSSYGQKKTVMDIRAEDKLSLTSERVDQTFWEKLFGGSHTVSSEVFDGIEAIKQLTPADVEKTDTEISESLYIGKQDVSDFKRFCLQKQGEGKTVFLLRHDVGLYVSQQVGQGSWDITPPVVGINGSDTNAYIFQSTVYLDFDLIELEYDDGEERVVLAAVSDPFDVVPGTNPPPTWQPSQDRWSIWEILMLLGLAVLLIITYPIWLPLFKLLVKAIVWIICAPFKLIGSLFKRKKE